MKHLLFTLLIVIIVLTSCKKEDPEPVVETNLIKSTDTLVSTSSFTSRNRYNVSGTLKTYKSNNLYTFVLENFSSDNGPALEVWISEGLTPNDFVSLGPLKSTSGTFSYQYDNTSGKANNYMVLHIWCKRFSVGFGSAAIDL